MVVLPVGARLVHNYNTQRELAAARIFQVFQALRRPRFSSLNSPNYAMQDVCRQELRRRNKRTMRYLDLTLPTPADNLALDEALLDEAEASATPAETLRLWEPQRPMVVVGRSSQFHVEVRLDACRGLGIPVLRRISGGAAVVAGPGCLMYALVLSYRLRPQLHTLSEAHRWVLATLVDALQRSSRQAWNAAARAIWLSPGGSSPATAPASAAIISSTTARCSTTFRSIWSIAAWRCPRGCRHIGRGVHTRAFWSTCPYRRRQFARRRRCVCRRRPL